MTTPGGLRIPNWFIVGIPILCGLLFVAARAGALLERVITQHEFLMQQDCRIEKHLQMDLPPFCVMGSNLPLILQGAQQ